jgi:excisionase family DNA binding protein
MQPAKPTSGTKEYYRPDELARALNVSCQTVRRWVRLDLIRHIHLPGTVRIPREEFERISRQGIGGKRHAKV